MKKEKFRAHNQQVWGVEGRGGRGRERERKNEEEEDDRKITILSLMFWIDEEYLRGINELLVIRAHIVHVSAMSLYHLPHNQLMCHVSGKF